MLGRIVRIRNGASPGSVLGSPLMCASRALGQLPFILEEVLKKVVAPLRRSCGPGDFQTAPDCVAAMALTKCACPPETLGLNIASFGFGSHILTGNRCAMRLAE